MTFYSHSKQAENGIRTGTKLLKDHIKGVAEKAVAGLGNDIDLTLKHEELRELVTVAAIFHDIGKYTNYFQNYLLNKGPRNNLLKQHSRIGGILAYNYLKNKDLKTAIIALYIVFNHHNSLEKLDKLPSLIDENLEYIFNCQKENLRNNIPTIEEEISLTSLNNLFEFPNAKDIRRFVRRWIIKDFSIKDYYTINYLFSLLIEADKLDASDTRPYKSSEIFANAVDERFKNTLADRTETDLGKLTNSELRTFCRKQVSKHTENKNILNNYLFTLTAPTGIGKTMISLDFALKLKNKIKEHTGNETKIIYALPFINIIEQAISEYEKTLPVNAKILGHYQYADVFGQSNNDDEKNYNQKLMEMETWQSDVIITSYVQFFETLIGNRNKLLKKFHHYAGAIIILDEVQTLRLDIMPLIGAALYYLSKFLKARIVLMTATKPKIFGLAKREILGEDTDFEPLELLSNHEEVFKCFNRTKIVPLINIELNKDEQSKDFIERIFSEKWEIKKSCIIVCNTVKRSIALYDAIKDYLQKEGFKNPIYYLSTNIVPCQRLGRIEGIKKDIKEDKAPILVSTQVVEAGVDLDFDIGFRDIGPIDSLIQVAGRINRNNDFKKANSPLYIVDFNESQKIYGRITYEQAKKALNQKESFGENEYLQLINEYFNNIADVKAFSKSKILFESMKKLNYTSDLTDDQPVSEFRIIQESKNTVSVFIEFDEIASETLRCYELFKKGKIAKSDFEIYKRDFNQRIIAIPDYLLEALKSEGNRTKISDNLYVVQNDIIENYYNNETGFIRSSTSNDITTVML